ncbi:malate dehydrogenase (oxaloacetate-decarboxylating) [Saccharomycopsis crataegensis]|uniref:Malic enzyme n=1 Tax=Saccharomycopsis crataegensis TaxID=43959 RepID=A0AAV5QQU4_9ASCO|nr:malate dehydrogenase (oxaloacetate-decarboxylating) [Saccharomycopsis crataegensis]
MTYSESAYKPQQPKQTRLSAQGPIECCLTGFQLLNSPLFNKGSAFTKQERLAFGLEGLLPPQINNLDEQVERAYKQLSFLKTPLAKNDFCTSMRQQNKVLFYELVRRHVRELLPIIYTPTEGDAIAAYSHRFRRPEGCFLDITDPQSVEKRLAAFGQDKDVDYIVVSDGEGILGIGDQGAGGVRIAISKLALMTLCGGIHPGRGIPICLDVGTNNQELANDELYMGNRFPRVTGEAYYEFADVFMQSVKKLFPNAIVHFEDFGVGNARNLLKRYRKELPCFNDDIQGTGAVVMASIIAALNFTKRELLDSKIVIFGSGSAGLGIADQIVSHMHTHGATEEQARSKIHCIDRHGLIIDSMDSTLASEDQLIYADRASDWEGVDTKSLLQVVSKVKPTILIGCSTRPGSFTEEVVKEMYAHNPQPIIFPLSNPTRLHEATPKDLMEWTDNNALVATGSPFKPVNGYVSSENNNCFSFPGIGLGAVLSRASEISEKMISAAVDELAKLSPKKVDPKAGLLPPVEQIVECSSRIATAVMLQAVNEGLARVENDGKVKVPRDYDAAHEWVKSQMWRPKYRDLIRVEHSPEIHTHQH